MKILLAENNTRLLESFEEDVLVPEGHEVTGVTSPAMARDFLAAYQFDLLITDLRLTNDRDDLDRSGYQLALEASQHLPVILMSSAFPDNLSLPAGVRPFHKRAGAQALLALIDESLNPKG